MEATHSVQRKPAVGPRTSPVTTNHSGQAMPFLDAIQQSFGRHDVSQIRAHTDRRAATEAHAMGAEAFTRGADVSFSRAPSLHTAAHEAAHVIQQRGGAQITGGMGGETYERHADAVADRVVHGQSSEVLLDGLPGALGGPPASHSPIIQMRRIPPNVRAILTSAAGANAVNFAASADGAQRLIDRAMAELTAADRAAVMTTRRGGLTAAQFDLLPRRERLSRHAEAIIALFPTRQLGDPNLIDTGPRPATPDAVNITTVVTNANAIFTSIASGARDTWVEQVFGVANVTAAKTKYAEARTWMNTLHAAGKILTDRSGFSDEVSEGGLTGFQEAIGLHPDVIDNPSDNESVVTLIHESLHAGNSDVGDNGYISAPQFTSRSEADKLENAAHFEVVPWRILAPGDPRAFRVVPTTLMEALIAAVRPTFQTFIPAGTTIGGVSAPALTPAEEGAKAASDQLEDAWALGLNLHRPYVQVFRTPTDWRVPQPAFGGMRFDRSLRFWSKVQKLTIHRKTINPASANPDKHPVSQIDIALSEGLTRKLAQAGSLLDPLTAEADILAFEASHSTTAERAAAFPGGAHTSVNAERDFLLKLAVRDPTVKPMTGTVARDLRVVRQLTAVGDAWTDILRPRDPGTFAD